MSFKAFIKLKVSATLKVIKMRIKIQINFLRTYRINIQNCISFYLKKVV